MVYDKEKDKNEPEEEIKENTIDPDVFYCPRCHSTSKRSENHLFCIKCGYRFLRGRQGELLIDQDNYGFLDGNTNIPVNNLPPLSIPQTYNSFNEQRYYQPPPSNVYPQYPSNFQKKKKDWSVGAGVGIPLLVFLISALLSFIVLLIIVAVNGGNSEFNSLETFIVASTSLIFLIFPLLWVQRYYSNKLTLKERFELLGFPQNKYSKKELLREILLGVFLGIIGIFLVFGLQTISYYIVYWSYGVDIINLMETAGVDQYTLTSPETSLDLILFVLMILLFVGVPEEILFRGFVQRSFETKLTKSAALFLTAVYFAIIHIFIRIISLDP